LTDDEGHVLRAYGGEAGALFLVRPDGYIGLIGGKNAIRAVERYLEEIFIRDNSATNRAASL
jgi:hypothetical protein